MSIATLDLAILAIVLLSAIIGLIRGLVKEVLSLASWLIAFLAAIYFSPQVAQQLPENWGGGSLRIVIAFGGLFVVALIASGIVQWLIAKLVEGSGLSGTDRFLGFLFGSARGLLVCVVVLIGLREIAAETSWWQASALQAELLAFEDDVRGLLGSARELVDDVPLPEVPGGSISY